MKFKYTIQPYQTEAVQSVVGVFAGQPFNDRFTYRRDAHIERDMTNWNLSGGLQTQESSSILHIFLKISTGFRREIISSYRIS